jgi:hypothetical protein
MEKFVNKSSLLLLFLISVLIIGSGLNSQGQASDSVISIKFFTKANVGAGFGLGYFNTDLIQGYQEKIRNDELLYAFTSVNGILISERTGIGIGVSAEPWKDGLFFPVFLQAFYDLTPKENTFYGVVSAGYSFGNRYSTSFYESGTGGFMLTLGVGYKSKISKRIRFEYEIFYNYQAVKSKYNYQPDSVSTQVDYTVPYHFVGFRLGIEYH